MTINQRVKIIVDKYYNGVPRRLATALGWDRADNMYNVLDEDEDGNPTHKRFGVDIVQEILKTHPDISAEWLMRGEGEMIKGKPQYPQDYEDTKKELKETTAAYIKVLNKYNKILEERQK